MPVSRIDRGKDTGRETLAAQGLPVSPPSFVSFWGQLATAHGNVQPAARSPQPGTYLRFFY
jgi:hypothetical protein